VFLSNDQEIRFDSLCPLKLSKQLTVGSFLLGARRPTLALTPRFRRRRTAPHYESKGRLETMQSERREQKRGTRKRKEREKKKRSGLEQSEIFTWKHQPRYVILAGPGLPSVSMISRFTKNLECAARAPPEFATERLSDQYWSKEARDTKPERRTSGSGFLLSCCFPVTSSHTKSLLTLVHAPPAPRKMHVH
jgi:hypothetical protein